MHIETNEEIMTSIHSQKFNKKTTVAALLSLFLLTTNYANSSQTWPPAANPVIAGQTFNNGESATITPGTTVVIGNGINMDFNAGSSLIFQANGTSFGRIDATGSAGAGMLFLAGSQIIFDVTGTLPPDGIYELLTGYTGAAGTLNVILRNGGSASISTIYDAGLLGNSAFSLKIRISGSSNTTVPSDIVVTNANGSTSTIFTTNIMNNIPITSCSADGENNNTSNSFNFSTPQNIAKDMYRFIAGSTNSKPKFMPTNYLPGTAPRQIDMMKAISNGQLPTTESQLGNSGTRIWMTGIYNNFTNNLDRKHYTADSRGFQLGMDSTKTKIPFGASFAYIASKPRLAHTRLGQTRTSQFGLYGGYGFNNLVFFATAFYGHSHNKLGNSLIAKQHFSTNTFGLAGMVSYRYYLSRKNILEPVAGLNYGHTWIPRINSFNGETITNTTRAKENDNVTSQIGLRFSHFIGLENNNPSPIKLYAQAMLKHNHRNKQNPSQIQVGSTSITNNSLGQRQPNNMADLGFGVMIRKCDLDLSLSAGGSFAKKVRSLSAMAGVRMPL